VQPEFPRFSEAEYSRRHQALAMVMQQREVDHLLIVTDQRTGNAPQWVTGWPGTVEAFVVFRPGERMTMHVEWYNHLPLARRIAQGVDVRWGEHRGIALAIEELARRGAKRVGLIGPLANRKLKELEARFEVVSLDAGADTITLGELLDEARKRLGPGAELELGRDVLPALVCQQCGAEDEMYRSLSRRAFWHALRKLIPEVRFHDIVRAGAGVRAQAVAPDGKLVDDFFIRRADRMVHVLNAPSPAATASIAIGRTIAEMALKEL